MVSRQTAIIALLAALLASVVTFSIDRIVLYDRAAAQQQSDEAAAMRWMAKGHDPAAPF
jgi:type II secretory pathway pseudopilin PulG